jgi:hypothetical protein
VVQERGKQGAVSWSESRSRTCAVQKLIAADQGRTNPLIRPLCDPVFGDEPTGTNRECGKRGDLRLSDQGPRPGDADTAVPQCGTPAAHPLHKAVTRFTLFFIPLFPVKTRHTTQCTFCGLTSRVSKDQATQLMQQTDERRGAQQQHPPQR